MTSKIKVLEDNEKILLQPAPKEKEERVSLISAAVEKVAKHYLPWVRNNNRANLLRSLLDDGTILGSALFLRDRTLSMIKKIVRMEFCAWKVLRAIDSSEQGGLNITGANIYRQVQHLEKYERGFLVSKGPVVRASKDL